MTKYSHIQSRNDLSAGSLRDHFLIAMPGMHDASFAHTITYVCDHNESGAMGLTLNHPMPLTLGDIFSQLELGDHAGLGAETVLAGGPVQVERGFVLHTGSSEWQSNLSIAQGINLTASRDILEALAEGRGPKEFLLALGYAGWEAGQLEEEIAANAWLTLPADRHTLFHTPAELRWSAVAHQLGIDLNLISTTAGHA
ncbi:YqgE/AlgH family protein [Marinimicrobium sp. ABcell2]|uniref:YqgE/AlgH family protein n=1 Tax=Marinimicrobium sp. ABcell2 TaxID=3069751 RepID=UPI0027B530DA|nr:YqgE/AlgH family protein [Marinimicrobium sp. ABcell2]MDQ2076580.1 YqgE/AlgH family protein [Marinimicrobium sp. ABcell2]